MFLGSRQHHPRRRADQRPFPREKECPCKSHGAEREIRSDGRSGRSDLRYHRGYAAESRDPEDALQGQQHPDLRRADRGSDAAGNRRADEDHEEPRKRRKIHPLHHP